MSVWTRCSVLTGGLLQFLISFLYVLQTKNLQRAFAFSLTADQLIDLSEATWIHQANLQVRGEAVKGSERKQMK